MGLRPLAALQQLRHRGDPGRRLRSKPTRLRKTLRARGDDVDGHRDSGAAEGRHARWIPTGRQQWERGRRAGRERGRPARSQDERGSGGLTR